MPSSSSLPLKAFDLSIINAYGNPKSFPNSILVDKLLYKLMILNLANE